MGGKFGYKNGDFPIMEQISNSLIRLPFYNDISEKDLNTILDEIKCYTLE
jgi:dTDP-4-amino-4,6-dideoxygalactose transaminase